MSEEDVALYLEWQLADGEEVANEVCGVRCLACGDVVIVEPGTREPVDESACVERIESMDDAEPHEVRIYCTDECRNDDLLRTDGGADFGSGDPRESSVHDESDEQGARCVDGTERFEPCEYDSPNDLLETWQSHFERLMEGRWPEDAVSLEWDTTDDEAVLRLEEPPENVTTVDRPGGGLSRSICVYFDRAIDAAQESHRYVSAQENPMGSGERKHSAMLTVPVADNRQEIMEEIE